MARRFDRMVLGAACVHLALGFFLSWHLNLWIDEHYSLRSTAEGAVEAFRAALEFELQPPLYFVLAALWRTIDASLLWTRLLSTLASTGFLLVTASHARRIGGPGLARATAGVLAVHPFTCYLASEARCYALVALLAALFVRATWECRIDPGRSGAHWRGLAIATAVLGLYTQLYFGFLLAASGVAVALLAPRRALLAHVIDLGLVAVLFAPGLLWVPDLFREHTAPWSDGPATPLSGVAQALGGLYGFAAPGHGVARHVAAGLFVALSLFGSLRAASRELGADAPPPRAARKSPSGLRFHLAIGIPLVAVFLAVAAWLGAEAVRPRHLTVLFPHCVLVVLLVARATMGARWMAGVALAAMVSSLALPWAPLRAGAKSGDWARVALALERDETGRTPVLVVPGEVLPLVTHYYDGAARVEAFPEPPSDGRWDPRRWALLDSRGLLRAARNLAGERGRLRVVHWTPGAESDPLLLEFIEQNARVEHRESFKDSVVWTLQLE